MANLQPQVLEAPTSFQAMSEGMLHCNLNPRELADKAIEGEMFILKRIGEVLVLYVSALFCEAKAEPGVREFALANQP